ncbi:MAG: zf-HC2 domain-containing protein [Candidatus Omnitrophica bacterium]|nr:zf-HC2 domain-containing protein [Candidatus Omnitrophota bacterium]
MRCEAARRLMMDRLYETLPPEKSRQLDAHIEDCPDCAAEWKDVKSAHAFMKFLPEQAVPAHLQQAVLQQSEMEALPPESEPFWQNWRKWSAAAVFILIVGVSYSLWDSGPQNLSSIAAGGNPDLNKTIAKLNGSLHPAEENEPAEADGGRERKEHKDTEPAQIKPSTQYAVIGPLDSKSQNAEELFQTGLRLYNKAFTKTGEDRKAMLRSAVLMLNDLETLYPSEKEWIAMGMILKADSHRAMDEPEKSIEAYRKMIERFSDMPLYCRQARASMIKVMLDRDSRIEEIDQQLTQFQTLAPPPAEFAQLALAFSEKISDCSPEQALVWYQRVQNSLPERHPIRNKAINESAAVEQKIRDRYYIEDWKVIGPFPQEMLPEIDSIPNQDIFTSLIRQAERFDYELVNLVQRKPKDDPVIDLKDLLQQSPAESSAFAQTYVYSPKEQWVRLLIGFTDGLRVWLNNDPVASRIERYNFSRDSLSLRCQFQEGWNSLFVKSYHIRNQREWKFSILITDNSGRIIPDLKYNALLEPAADSN